jgi:hypothetical protein
MISGNGVKFDPVLLQGLLYMSCPNSDADLQQLMCELDAIKHAHV